MLYSFTVTLHSPDANLPVHYMKQPRETTSSHVGNLSRTFLTHLNLLYIVILPWKCSGTPCSDPPQGDGGLASNIWQGLHYTDITRASQNPIRPIRRTRAADFGPSLSMFKKAADIEVSYKTMYVCTAAENFFVTSWTSQWPTIMASQITGNWTVCSTFCSGAHQRKHQSSASMAFLCYWPFVRGIHQSLLDSPHKWPVTQKMFPWHHHGVRDCHWPLNDGGNSHLPYEPTVHYSLQ